MTATATIDVFGPANATNYTLTRPFDGRQFAAQDTYFQDCSSPTSTDGTDVQAAWLNQIVQNSRSIARANGLQLDGLTPVVKQDNGDDLLLRGILSLIQRNQANFAVDQGVPNLVIIQPSFSPVEILAGMPFLVEMAAAPTGPTTMKIGTFPAFSVRKSGGALLTGGEWEGGDLQPFAFDGTYIRALGVGAGNVPQLVSGPAALTMTVPEQYPTIRAALLASSCMTLRSDASIAIVVDKQGYVEQFDSSLGPLIGNHPYGQRITVTAPALTIGFPSGDDLDAKSASATQQLLQGRFGATIQAVNGANVLEIRAGTLNFANFLFMGDGSAGQQGPSVGPWQTTASSGNLGLTNCAVHNFGGDNIQVTDDSVLRVNNVCSTYAGLAALRTAREASTTMRTGSLVTMYSGIGVAAIGGQLRIDSGAGRWDCRRNTGAAGMQATGKGVIGVSAGPAVYVEDNSGWGAMGYDGDVILPSATVWARNGAGDCYAAENGLVDNRGGNPGATSPYRNYVGNNDGQVLV